MKTRYALWATLVSLAVAIPALAQQQTPPMTATGTVVSVSDDQIVVRTDDGEQRTFAVDTSTSWRRADINSGARVTVRYRMLDGSRFQATNVTLAERDERPSTRSEADPVPSPGPGAPTSDTGRESPSGDFDDDRLPATASPVPLLVLGGFLGLVGGSIVRFVSRRS